MSRHKLALVVVLGMVVYWSVATTSNIALASNGDASSPGGLAILLASQPAVEPHLMGSSGGTGMATLPILVLGGALALLHIVGNRLPLFSVIPLYRWTSFAGGVSITYVFLEVFPGLAKYQALQEESVKHFGIIENHIYLMALAGLVAFYSIDIARDRYLANNLRRSQSVSGSKPHPIFWIRIGAFTILNVIFGYLLQDLGHHTVLGCLLFFMAVGLHFYIIDTTFREHFQELFDRVGRWILAGALLLGMVLGFFIQFDATALAVIWSFLAGSIILNVLRRELPEANQTCYRSFLLGCGVFVALVLSA